MPIRLRNKTSRIVTWLFGEHPTPTRSCERSSLARLGGVMTWNDQVVRIGGQLGPSARSVPVLCYSLCYSNPLNLRRYVIVNSGHTFREVHDKNNSLQNPKLPDWAILEIAELRSIESAGRVFAVDFFDSQWSVQSRVNLPQDRV